MSFQDIIDDVKYKIEFRKNKKEIVNQAGFYNDPSSASKAIFIDDVIKANNILACLKEIEKSGVSGAISLAMECDIKDEFTAIVEAYQNGQPSPVVLTFNKDGDVNDNENPKVFCNPFIYAKDGCVDISAIYSDGFYGIDGVDQLPHDITVSKELIDFVNKYAVQEMEA